MSDDDIENIEVEKDDNEKSIKKIEIPPLQNHPDWSEYVLKQFTDDEIINGNVTTDGCRRVVEKVLGEIIYSVPKVIQSPNPQNDNHTVVEHLIKIRKFDGTIIKFGDCADVYHVNTPGEFCLHAVATASTKAEGRALRKSLKLKRMMVAEEVSNMPIEPPSKIKSNQISYMNMMCERNNIDVIKFINISKKAQYKQVEDIPYATAVQMNKFLSDVQNETKKVPESIIGYNPKWRDE